MAVPFRKKARLVGSVGSNTREPSAKSAQNQRHQRSPGSLVVKARSPRTPCVGLLTRPPELRPRLRGALGDLRAESQEPPRATIHTEVRVAQVAHTIAE